MLDAEVSASGFTRQMEKDLLAEIGLGEVEDDEKDEEEVECDSKEQDIECLRQKLEECVSNDWNNESCKSVNVTVEKSTEKSEVVAPAESRAADCCMKSEPKTTDMSDYGSDENSDAESEVCTVRSVSTTTTIAPEVIRDRVKRALEKRNKTTVRQRCLAKGEASATTRQRRENRDNINQSTGLWGWE